MSSCTDLVRDLSRPAMVRERGPHHVALNAVVAYGTRSLYDHHSAQIWSPEPALCRSQPRGRQVPGS